METLITIGEEFPLFKNGSRKMQFKDGGILEALEDSYGFWYHMFINKPHPNEIDVFRHEKISVRLINESNFVLPLIRFGKTQMIFEMSFDPTLYKDSRAFQITKTNNLLTFVLIDSSNSVVMALRQSNLPLRFIQICKENWAKAFLDNSYSEKYKLWYTKLQEISLIELWNRALYVGKMGETYSLNEIQYQYNSQHYLNL